MRRLDMYLLHMTEGVNKYRQSMNQMFKWATASTAYE